MVPKRRQAATARGKDPWWREHWQEAMQRVAGSTFCHGGGDKGWRAGIDWFLRPDTVARILEGKYDDRDGRDGRPSDPRGNLAVVNRYLDSIEREEADRVREQ